MTATKVLEANSVAHSSGWGTQQQLTDFIEEGFYIGLTGYIVKEERGRALRSFLPETCRLERLMIETDAPLIPFASDDPRAADFDCINEPCTLPIIAEAVAKCYGVGVEDLAGITTKNAQLFFQRSFGVTEDERADTLIPMHDELSAALRAYGYRALEHSQSPQ